MNERTLRALARQDVHAVLSSPQCSFAAGQTEMALGLLVGMALEAPAIEYGSDVGSEIDFVRGRRREFGRINLGARNSNDGAQKRGSSKESKPRNTRNTRNDVPFVYFVVHPRGTFRIHHSVAQADIDIRPVHGGVTTRGPTRAHAQIDRVFHIADIN